MYLFRCLSLFLLLTVLGWFIIGCGGSSHVRPPAPATRGSLDVTLTWTMANATTATVTVMQGDQAVGTATIVRPETVAHLTDLPVGDVTVLSQLKDATGVVLATHSTVVLLNTSHVPSVSVTPTPTGAGAQPLVGTMTPILAPLPGYPFLDVSAMNNHGQIVGTSITQQGLYRATLWAANGTPYDIGVLPGYKSSHALAINDAGQVVGRLVDNSGYSHAFRWTESEGLQALGYLPDTTTSIANGINEAGTIVGMSGQQPFLWTSANGMQPLTGITTGTARDINNRGQVVGHYYPSNSPRAYIWSADAGLQELGVFPGCTSSLAVAINDAGQVVGSCEALNAVYRAFLWTAENGIRDLGTLEGHEDAKATAINENGLIAGWSSNNGGDARAFLWTAGAGMQNLGYLPTPSYSKWSRAYAINNAGQVIGKSYDSAFIWSPQ